MKITHDDIRRVGGIVHSDGNIFFTNIDKLNELVAPLEALSVTKIMLDVQPGFEGEGVEVYAKSVAEVEQLLGSMGERLENFELGIDIAKPVKDRITNLEKFATFQQQVKPWLLSCFGEEIASDRSERNHRFLEEALELVQACGCTKEEAIQLVDYVYGRPLGEPHQEVGGVMVTLAALCLAQKLDMHEAGATELKRIWTKVEQIRAKQAAKPKHSPLPGHAKDSK